jgi:hypothetical protein
MNCQLCARMLNCPYEVSRLGDIQLPPKGQVESLCLFRVDSVLSFDGRERKGANGSARAMRRRGDFLATG